MTKKAKLMIAVTITTTVLAAGAAAAAAVICKRIYEKTYFSAD